MAGIDDRIEESKNWFERMAEHVPGYKGYKDKELRREASNWTLSIAPISISSGS